MNIEDWSKTVTSHLSSVASIEVAIAPPYPLLDKVPSPFTRCAQDVSQFTPGAHTGEVGGQVLHELGVKYCLVGHSERRRNFGETNDVIAQKIERLKENGITPILCAQDINEIPLIITNLTDFFVMFEPWTAISTNGNYHPETPESINDVLTTWSQKFPSAKLLYGGSVNPDFVNNLLQATDYKLLAGFVVGHASLNPVEFSGIIDACQSFVAG